jgi:hypothetical protein
MFPHIQANWRRNCDNAVYPQTSAHKTSKIISAIPRVGGRMADFDVTAGLLASVALLLTKKKSPARREAAEVRPLDALRLRSVFTD